MAASITFGNHTVSNSGMWGSFMTKYVPGSGYSWVVSAGGTGSEGGDGLDLDDYGNLYANFYFDGSTTLKSTTGNFSKSFTPNGGADIIFMKISPNGTINWSKQFGSTGMDYGWDITHTQNNEVILSGTFSSTISFGAKGLTSTGNLDVFVAAFDTSGTVIWATKAGGTGQDYSNGHCLDNNDNILVSGYFHGTVNFGSNSLNAGNSADAFLFEISNKTSPQISSSATQLGCGNDSIKLWDKTNAGKASYSYDWYKDGQLISTSSSSYIYTNQAGAYYFKRSGSCVSDSSTSITITGANNLTVSLGPDTVLCQPGYVLDAGNAGSSYLWSDGSTAQTLTLNSGGVHAVWVRVKNGGCTVYDSVQVVISNVKADLGPDVVECDDSVTLSAGSGPFTYYWSTGSYKNSIRVGQSGLYSIVVSDTLDCNAFDTISVTLQNLNMNLGPDTTRCDSIRLDTKVPGATYQWSTGAGTQSIKVTQSGTYWVTVTKGKCKETDSVTITINKITADLGPARGTCDDSLELNPGGPSGATYIWNEGQTTSSIWVKSSGNYSVTVTDPVTGCKAFTKVFIEFYPKANASFSYVNNGGQVKFTAAAPPTSSQSWDFGDGSGSSVKNPTHTYSTAGNYTVKLSVTTDKGCKADHSQTIGANTGLGQVQNMATYSLWPNPTRGNSELSYTLRTASPLTITLTDLAGRTLLSLNQPTTTTGNQSLPTSTLAPGTYLLILTPAGSSPTVQKLVVY